MELVGCEDVEAGSYETLVSLVVHQIYRDYPILEKVMSQDELIAWIDAEIDNALPTLREIWKQNEENNTQK